MKNKKVIIPITIIIIITLIIATIIIFNKGKTSPEDVLKQYMSHIINKEYEAMYELTTKETSQEDYITRNKNIYEGIEVSKIDINVAKTSEKGKEAEVIYTTTMSTIAGEISFSNTANLIKESGKYYFSYIK